MIQSKAIGSTFLLIGTAIGAGMLALPIISALAGFKLAVILIIAIWALMCTTALLVLEVNLAFSPPNNNFNTMAFATLGRPGQIIAWLTCLLLLYSLTSAYISGNALLFTLALTHALHHAIPVWINAILFTLIFGMAVFWSTRATDVLNRGLFSIKGILLVIMLVTLLPHVNFVKLIQSHTHAHYLMAAAPIFLTAFGFHTVIPSISTYTERNAKVLKHIIIFGSIIPLLVYLFWLICTLGIIPLMGAHSFTIIQNDHGSVRVFVQSLDSIVNDHWVSIGINGFADVAMTTSFLGVTLGLFDFITDATKRNPNKRSHRLQVALLTFLPPLGFALFYPRGFILALGYAAIFVAILEVIMPAMMAYKLRKTDALHSPIKIFGGTALLWCVSVCGVLLIAIQLFDMFSK